MQNKYFLVPLELIKPSVMSPKKPALFVLMLLFAHTCINAQERTTIELNNGWKFAKGSNEKAFENNFNDKKWQTITVPHDWAIYGPFDKEIDKQTTAIVQNGEKVATEKQVELELCLILVKLGTEINFQFPISIKTRK
jgi:hypothetical protein